LWIVRGPSRPEDRIAVARAMAEPVSRIEALGDKEFLQKEMITGKIVSAILP